MANTWWPEGYKVIWPDWPHRVLACPWTAAKSIGRRPILTDEFGAWEAWEPSWTWPRHYRPEGVL